jgi:protein gp37
MAENSKIEWCHHTFNPWRGCTKVSPGCAHCYAETLSRRNPAVLGEWGPGRPRVKASAAMWRQPLKWNEAENWKKVSYAEFVRNERPRVFCASLADWLDDEVPIEWLAELLGLIHQTPNLNWLLLTKRPQNWAPRIRQVLQWAQYDEAVHGWLSDWRHSSKIPANIWMGTSVEDQTRANERIPALLAIPARVRFLSCEPLLGPVNLRQWLPLSTQPADGLLGAGIQWIIAGGESGPDARPMHPDWARSLRDQCGAAGVPFLFNQWGEYAPTALAYPIMSPHAPPAEPNDIAFTPVNQNGRQVPFPVHWVGKKKAGRTLDGQIHNEFPHP